QRRARHELSTRRQLEEFEIQFRRQAQAVSGVAATVTTRVQRRLRRQGSSGPGQGRLENRGSHPGRRRYGILPPADEGLGGYRAERRRFVATRRVADKDRRSEEGRREVRVRPI